MPAPRLNIRPAVHDYLQACEHILSIAAAAHPPFSEDELRIVNYYAMALAKLVAQRAKI